MKRFFSFCILFLTLATPGYPADYEFSHPIPLSVTHCVTTRLGCQFCSTLAGDRVSYSSDLKCFAPGAGNAPAGPDAFNQSLQFSDGLPSPGAFSSSNSWPNIPPSVIQGLATIVNYLAQPSPYKVVSENVDWELNRYETQVRKDIQSLGAESRQRENDWAKAAPEMINSMAGVANEKKNLSQSARAAAEQNREKNSTPPSVPTGASTTMQDLLKRAAALPAQIREAAASIPPQHLSPDATSLGDTWRQMLSSRSMDTSRATEVRVRQERARMDQAPSSSHKTLASQSLSLADRFSRLSGSAAQEVSAALRSEARRLRHQAEGRIRSSPPSAPLTRWMTQFLPGGPSYGYGDSQPPLELKGKATTALAQNAEVYLDQPRVLSHLDGRSVEWLRGQLASARGLSDSALASSRQPEAGTLSQTMMDLAYGSVKSVYDFTAGLSTGLFDGFYDTAKVAEAILTKSGVWDRIVNAVMHDLTENPVQFIGKALEPLVDYARVLQSGTASEIGHASGELFAQLLIGATVGQPLSRVAGGPLKSALTSAKGAISESGVARALGKVVDGSFSKLPGTGRLARGVLTAPDEISAYAGSHPALDALPNQLRPKRILVGAVGRDEKIAIIARPMEKVVNETERILGKNGLKVERFNPPDELVSAFTEFSKQFPNGWIPYEAVSSTELYKTNAKWIQQMMQEGYTIIDLGDPLGSSFPSAFYDMELSTVFGKTR